MGPGRVLLVRHGETELNRLLCCQGWKDEPLNDTGRREAAEVAATLRTRRIARIVASPLRRAQETAKAIAAHHALPVENHLDLRELYHGELEGVPFDELDNHVPGIREAWRTRPHTVHMPGGETLDALQVRAWRAFDHITAEYLHNMRNGGPYGDLVLVAHGLTINTILCKVNGHGLDGLRQYRLMPCGFWEIEENGGGWDVVQGVRRFPDDLPP